MEPLDIPHFIESQPTLESCWRSIILFGRNVASYKFALGKTLLELSHAGNTFVSLEDLAEPFTQHVAQHLELMDKQATSPSSSFLEACRHYNRGDISKEKLRDITVQIGFNNVIDAFHVVSHGDTPRRFFLDERKQRKGILLTDDLFILSQSFQFNNLPSEIEARWRLVETAWSLGTAARPLEVNNDRESCQLFVETTDRRRISITSVRDALNGYQKGKCFYCFRDIALQTGTDTQADVDHFFPWSLGMASEFTPINLDGVWNLVLACIPCNRGTQGKWAQIPTVHLLERLHRRNSFLIESHHPLRETLRNQTGLSDAERRAYLQRIDRLAINHLPHRWQATWELAPAF